MSRLVIASWLLTFSPLLVAQPKTSQANKPIRARVLAHSLTDIPLPLQAIHADDCLDILVGDEQVHLILITPTGEELNPEKIDLMRFSWEQFDQKDFDGRKINVLLPGAGIHNFILFNVDYPAGEYKLRVDAQQANADTAISIKLVSAEEMRMALLDLIPGAVLTKSVTVPAGVKRAVAKLTLPKGEEGDYLDIVTSDPSVKLRLLLPDGRTIDVTNAKRLGAEWDVTTTVDSDPLAFMVYLPMQGTHTLIGFPTLLRPAGQYTIEADSSAAKRESQVQALFVPLGKLLKDADTYQPPPAKLTVALHFPQGKIYQGDPQALTLQLSGEPVSGPITFIGQIAGRADATNIPVTLTFTAGADHIYRATFTPAVRGLVYLQGTVSGVMASGEEFSVNLTSDSVHVEVLLARFKGFIDHIIEDHNGKADRLEITAKLDVVQAGKYTLRMWLSDEEETAGGKMILKEVERVLQAGPQEITASVSGEEMYDLPPSYPPFHIRSAVINTDHGTVDIPKGDVHDFNSRMVAYERKQWDGGNLTGLRKIVAEPVDLLGTGRFQALEVRWDVFTPGGDCSWIGELSISPTTSDPTIQSRARAHLQAGISTLSFKFDGAKIAQAGGDHKWKFEPWRIGCDGRKMPGADRGRLETAVLHSSDFDKLPPDFSLSIIAPTPELRPGGPLRGVEVEIEPVGELSGVVALRVSGAPAGLDVEAPSPPRAAQWNGDQVQLAVVMLHARQEMRPGRYNMTIVAEGDGRSHSVPLEITIAEAFPALPATTVLEVSKDTSRPANVLLVLGNTTSLHTMCQSMRDLARTLPEQLLPGHNRLGALVFGVSVSVPMPPTSDFQKASDALNRQLLEVHCGGPNNLTYALEKAHDILASHAITGNNAVVVVTGQGPTMITAEWPVRTLSDHRAWIARPLKTAPQVQLAVSSCPDAQGRTSNNPGWASEGSMPDLRGAFWILRDQAGGIPRGPLISPDSTNPSGPYEYVFQREKKEPTCSFASAEADVELDVAYLPENDAEGVPLTGARPLERFADGPYQGKIRPDLASNWANAKLNEFENAVRRLREDPAVKARVIMVSMFPISIPEEIAALAQQGVTVIPVFAAEQLPGALDQIWNRLGRAKVH